MPPGAGAAAEAGAAAGIGQTVGTFSSTGEGLGIGPELNKLEQPARETAVNTARAAGALEQMAAANRMQPADAAGDGGVAAGVVAPQAGRMAAAVQSGAASADWSGLAKVMETGTKAIVDAINAHAKLTAAGNGTLASIDQKLSTAGAVFV